MKQSVRDVEAAGKTVLVRVDFNVPFDQDGGIADDSRIRAALPTIRHLQEQGARIVLCSHLGRPDGAVVESLRLKPVAARLAEVLGQPVATAVDCIGPGVEEAVAELKPGGLLLLENLRFHPGEERNDPQFARALASLADLYVNDAFGAAHRAHASTAGVAAYLPAVAGLLMLREVEELGNVLGSPERPLAAVIGGAKVSSKVGVLKNLLPRVDYLLLGGGIASTFLRAQGLDVGDSLIEEDQVELAQEIEEAAKAAGVRLLLPSDVVVADRFAADAEQRIVAVSAVAAGWRIMDAGPQTLDAFTEALGKCRTIFWNGTLGVAEFPRFAEGSLRLARFLAGVDARVVVGGGETAALVAQAGLGDRYTHVSTGGGASLEFIEGRTLPGVAVLRDR